MVVALIFVILIAVFVAFFIGKNLSYSCQIWLFKTFDSTNIAAIVFFAFAAGVLFALLCLFIGKIIKASHNKDKENAVAEAVTESKKEEKKEKKLSRKERREEKSKKEDKTEKISDSTEQKDEKKSDDKTETEKTSD